MNASHFDQDYLFAIQACQLAIGGFGSAHLGLTQALRLYQPPSASENC